MRGRAMLAAAAAALIASAAPVAASSTRGATVRVADTNPVTVTGSRFLPRERVLVRATLDGARHVRRVRATAGGRIRAVFAGVVLADRCSSELLVRAIGARGSTATAKIGPLPQCPPRLSRP